MLLGLAGAAISAYVWRKQVTTGPVWCIGDGCAKVIRSSYGRLLGVPNGLLGVVFFGSAALTPMIADGLPAVWTMLSAAAAVALVLYTYLTYLQLRVLRAVCVWCLASAALAAGIALTLAAR